MTNPSPDRRLDRLALWGPAAAVFLVHVIFAATYGIFRDEMYYLSCAKRLAWGYVDQPPFVAFLTANWTAIFGDSLRALRALPALAVAATAAIVGSSARALGGGRFAVALAGLAFGFSPVILSLASVLSMNSLDLLFWALGFRLLAALLAGGDERGWLLFGAIAGVGLLNKISMLFLGFGVVLGLLVARRWDALRSRYFWLGGLLAGALFAPHLLWQRANGWPTLEFMENARRFKNVDYTAGGFLGEVALQSGPVQGVIWIAGLAALLLAPRFRPWRPLGFAFLAVLAVMLSTSAKPYYLSPAYSILAAAGAVALEEWSAAIRSRRVVRVATVTLLVSGSVLLLPLARPVLPVEDYVRYSTALGFEPGTDERHEIGRLPQFYADMQEWREMAAAVGRAADRLTAEERARACVFGQNYGQAGAVERFAAEFNLPRAISAHNSWFLWGPADCADAPALLVMDDERERLSELFEEVELGATFDCRDCMPYEDNLQIWIARRPRLPLSDFWNEIKNFS